MATEPDTALRAALEKAKASVEDRPAWLRDLNRRVSETVTQCTERADVAADPSPNTLRKAATLIVDLESALLAALAHPAAPDTAPADRGAGEVAALHIVFDGPPGPSGGRFVEVETPAGKSVSVGSWHDRRDGLTELRIPRHVLALPAPDPQAGSDSPAASGAEGLRWHPGVPPKPWSEDWFIAKTTYGDRVVLRALPEEYTYDFETADATYIKADKIKQWMQFPDGMYVEYIAPPPAVPATRDAGVDREAVLRAAGFPIDTPRGGYASWFLRNLTHYREGCSGQYDDEARVQKLIDALAPTPSKAPGQDAVETLLDMRERCAKLCDERADYFDRAPGHRDWKDAARSYRHTAIELRGLPLNSTALAALRSTQADTGGESQTPAPAGDAVEALRRTAEGYSQRVCEWDDRTSPEDYPHHLLITARELEDLLIEFAGEAAALAAIPQGPGAGQAWQPIETAPKDGTQFLALTTEAQSPTARISWWDNDRFLTTGKPEKFVDPLPHRWWPTHWMPLPPAPTLATDGEGR